MKNYKITLTETKRVTITVKENDIVSARAIAEDVFSGYECDTKENEYEAEKDFLQWEFEDAEALDGSESWTKEDQVKFNNL